MSEILLLVIYIKNNENLCNKILLISILLQVNRQEKETLLFFWIVSYDIAVLMKTNR